MRPLHVLLGVAMLAISAPSHTAEEVFASDRPTIVFIPESPRLLITHQGPFGPGKPQTDNVTLVAESRSDEKLASDCAGTITKPDASLKDLVITPGPISSAQTQYKHKGKIPCYEVPTRQFVETLIASRIDSILPADASSGATKDNVRLLVREEIKTLEEQVAALRQELQALKNQAGASQAQ